MRKHVERGAKCEKRGYDSEKAARDAHRHARWRLRVYFCKVHRKFHVTNSDKDD